MTSRRAALGASAVLAALLNAGVLGMAAQSPRPALPTAAAAPAPHLRAPIVLVAPAAAPAVPTQPVAARVDAPTLRQAAPRAAAPAPVLPAPHDDPATPGSLAVPVVAGASEPADDAPQALRFYAFHEVDRAAAPESDWPLDVELLDAIGIARLVFEVRVSDRGDILACSVLDPSGLPEAMRDELEARLAATPLNPALRAGRFVASVRRIELQIEPVL